MKKMKNYLLIFLLIGSSLFAFAQRDIPAELAQRLGNEKDFYKVKATVEKYYKGKAARLSGVDSVKLKAINRQRKFWNRWFYESEGRLNTNGEVENVAEKLFEHTTASTGVLMETEEASRDQVSNASWSHIGPTYVSSGIGRINRVVMHPSNQNILYAGSAAGGLYKSTNAGVNWSAVSSYLPSLGVSGIVVSHSDGQTIYVLTGDGDAYASRGFNFQFGYIRYSVGVLKSTDGGQTWTKAGTFPGVGDKRYVGFRLKQDPNNANVLLAATSMGMFRTTNGGNTWQKVTLNGASTEQTTVFDIEYKPGSSSVVYCTFIKNPSLSFNDQECVFAKSTNSGQTFSSTATTYSHNIIEASRIEIGVTPADPSYVYLLCGPGYVTEESDDYDEFKGLYRSTNSGDYFSRRSNSPDILAYQDILNQFKNQSKYDLAIAVSPTNPEIVVAGGLVVWRSDNGGRDWSEIVDYFEDIDNSNYIHPDVHDLVYSPLNGYLYAATDGGAAVSADNGDNWSRLFSGLSCTQFYKFEVNNEDGDIWGGTQDNGVLIRDGSSSTFDEFDGGDGYDVMTDKAPAGNNNDKYWVINKGIWADGVVDVNITPDEADDYFPNLAMSPTDEDVIYAGYPNLFVSYNRGDDWFKFDNIAGNWALASCPTNRRRVYSAGRKDDSDGNLLHQGIWRVDNIGGIPPTSTNLTNALKSANNFPAKMPKITGIAVSPSGSNVVWVTIGGFNEGAKVYYSDNSGTSWLNVSGSLPNLPVNCITICAEGVYIGTDIGVYFRANQANDWIPWFNGMPRVPVSEIEVVYDVEFTPFVYAATYGRGIWRSKGFTECAASLTISNEQQGQRYYQATDITSTAVVSANAGTDVKFVAASSVILQPGFHAVAGSDFLATIGPCYGTGISMRVANIISDSIAAKITDAVQQGSTINVSLQIIRSGSYKLRVVDLASNTIVSEKEIDGSKTGAAAVALDVAVDKIKYYRVDLLHNQQLISVQDFEINQ